MTIQEILEAHYVSLTIESRLWCRTCGLIAEERHFSATKNHELKLAHVAEVLDKHMQEREAKAWEKGEGAGNHNTVQRLRMIQRTSHEPFMTNPYEDEGSHHGR